MNLDHGTAIRSTFLYLWSVGGAVSEDWLVVIDISDEDHHHGGAGVDSLGVQHHTTLHAALAIVHSSHIELVLVSVQVDGTIDQTNDSGVGLDPEETRGGGAANKAKGDSISVLATNN